MADPGSDRLPPLSPAAFLPASSDPALMTMPSPLSPTVDEPTQRLPPPLPAAMPSPPWSRWPLRRRRRRRRRPARPAESSLQYLLRQHPGISLFVRPVCWLDLHSRLLGASFYELPPCQDPPSPPDLPWSSPVGLLPPSRALIPIYDSLAQMLLYGSKRPILGSLAVEITLSTFWPAAFANPQSLPQLPIYYGNRVYRDAVRTQLMWNYPWHSPPPSPARDALSLDLPSLPLQDPYLPVAVGKPSGRPMLCYISKSQLAFFRQNPFRTIPGPGRAWNGPVYRLQQARSRALHPANLDHDPYFVAVFLAMAQHHHYPPPPPSAKRDSLWWPAGDRPPRPEFEDLTLGLLTHDDDTAEFILYTGRVTANFLNRFHDPWRTPDDMAPVLELSYRRVPIWPVLGLRERLGRALDEDLIDLWDNTKIGSWQSAPEPAPVPVPVPGLGGEQDAAGKGQRGSNKRAALAEVFNRNLEDEADDEGESGRLGVKRRCLDKGSPVGVAV